jgi:hypothetical protein
MQVLMRTFIIIAAPSGVYHRGFHLDALKILSILPGDLFALFAHV